MRVRVVHPEDQRLVAVAGHDRSALGWFCEIHHEGIREEYSGLTHGKPTTLQGVLDVLVRHGFFSREELHEGLALAHFGFDPEEIEGEGARRAAEIVEQLKQAAGD